MKLYLDGQLVGVFRTRADGRYQRRVHSRVFTRDDLHAWVERMNRQPCRHARWRIEDDSTSTESARVAVAGERGRSLGQSLFRRLRNRHYVIACMSGVNSSRELDVLMDWGVPRSRG